MDLREKRCAVWMSVSWLVVVCLLGQSVAPAGEGAEEKFRFAKSLLLDRQEYDLAAAKFSAFAKEHPEHASVPEALLYVGYCYARQRKNGQAAGTYESILKRYPAASAKIKQDAIKNGADAYFRNGDFAKAAALYTRLFKEYSDSPVAKDALFWRATAYDRIGLEHRNAGRVKEGAAFAGKAVADFEAYINRCPASKSVPIALRNAGINALDMGDPKKAEALFTQLIQDFPRDARAEYNLFQLAESLYRQGRYIDATQAYAKVMKAFPAGEYSSDARSGMAWCDYMQGKILLQQGDTAQGRSLLEKAAKGLNEAGVLAGKNQDKALQARYDAARIYSEVGDHNRAIENMKLVGAADNHRLQGGALFNLGAYRLEQAKVIGRKLEGVASATIQPKGLKQQHLRLLKEAKAYLENAIASPSIGSWKPEALTFLGEANLDLGEFAEAERIFNTVATEFPQDERAPLALYHRAFACRQQNKINEAADAIRRLIKTYPTHRLRLKAAYVMADYQTALGKVDKGRLAYRWLASRGVEWASGWKDASGKGDPALVEKARELASDSMFRLGESYYMNEKKPAEAAPFYRKVLSDHPESEPAGMSRLRLGEIAEADGKLQEAVNYYAKILAGDKDTRAYRPALYHLAVLQYSLAQADRKDAAKRARYLKGGLSYLQRFLKRFPGDGLVPDALHYQGEILYALGRVDEAIASYNACIKASPQGRFADAALYGLGWCQRDSKRPKESRTAFQRLIDEHPQSTYRPEALYLMAVEKHEAKDYKAALEDIEVVLKSYNSTPFAPRSLLEKGRILDDMKQHREAVAIFNRFLAAYGKHNEVPYALDGLSFAWWHLAEPRFAAAKEAEAAYGKTMNSSSKKEWESKLKKAREVEDQVVDALAQLTTKYPDFERIDYAWLRFGEIAYDRKLYDDALGRYRKALDAAVERKEEEHAAAAQYRIGWCLLRQAEAAEKLASTATDDVRKAKLQKQMATRRKESLAAFETLTARYPGNKLAAEGRFRCAELKRGFGQYAEALAQYNAYLQSPGETADITFVRAARYGIGVSLLELQRNTEALKEFKAFLQTYKEGDYYKDACWGAGQACLNLQAYGDATDYYHKTLADDYRGEAAARARLGLGMIALEKKDWEKAREEFLKVDAFHAEWRTWAALALLKSSEAARQLKQPKKAMKDLDRIVNRYGDTPAAVQARREIEKEQR